MVRVGLVAWVLAVCAVGCGGRGAGGDGGADSVSAAEGGDPDSDGGVDVVGSDEPAPADVVDACVRGAMGEGASCQSACDCAEGLSCEFTAAGCVGQGACGHPATGCDAGAEVRACGCEGTTLTSCATQFEQAYQSLGACAMMY